MLLTQAEWARQKGFTRQNVQDLIKNGVVVLTSDKKVDTDQADAALAATTNPAMPRRRNKAEAAATSEAPSNAALSEQLFKARVSSEISKAMLLKIQENTARGKFVDIEEVKKTAFQLGRMVRNRVLGIPDRVAAILAAEVDPKQVRMILLSELRQALEDLEGD